MELDVIIAGEEQNEGSALTKHTQDTDDSFQYSFGNSVLQGILKFIFM